MKFVPMRLGETLASGWIEHEIEVDMAGYYGHMDNLCSQVDLEVFHRRRLSDVVHALNWWDGESTGNWLDGMVRSAFVLRDPQTQNRVQELIDKVLESQDADGYLGMYDETLKLRDKPFNGEFWTSSRLLLALLDYYYATKRVDVLEAIQRACRLFVDSYGPKANGRSYFHAADESHISHGLMLAEVMLALYALTSDREYVDFARFCYEDYSSSRVLTRQQTDCQKENLLKESRLLVGHGATTAEGMRIPVLLGQMLPDDSRQVYEIIGNIGLAKLERQVGLSGGIRSDESTGIPLPESGVEFCAITELLLTWQAAFAVTGDAKYGDLIEKLCFNIGEAARDKKGNGVAYCTAENVSHMDGTPNARWAFSPTHETTAVCCPPNAGRLLPSYVKGSWGRTERGLVALCYGPCQLNTVIEEQPLTILEETLYPFSDRVNFVVKTKSPIVFEVAFRIPAWSSVAVLHVNGTKQDDLNECAEDRWIKMERQWSDGDEVSIRFLSRPSASRAVDGSVAWQKGPLVYSRPLRWQQSTGKTYHIDGEKVLSDKYYTIDDDTPDLVLLMPQNPDEANEFAKFREVDSGDHIGPPMLTVLALQPGGNVESIDLQPLSTTILRQTTFPFVTLSAENVATLQSTYVDYDKSDDGLPKGTYFSENTPKASL